MNEVWWRVYRCPKCGYESCVTNVCRKCGVMMEPTAKVARFNPKTQKWEKKELKPHFLG